MTRAEYLKRYIADRWSGDRASEVCLSIIDFIVSNPSNKSSFLTYNSIARISDSDGSDVNDLIRAVSILSGRFSALKMHFVFIDEQGAEFPLPDEDAKDILSDGYYVHPNTRERIEGISKYIYPYYEGDKPRLLSEA